MIQESKSTSEYRNNYEIKIELLVSYPEIFDSGKINVNLNNFFDDYFDRKPANEFAYNGMSMFFAKAFMTDSCKIKIIFEKEKIEFLDEIEVRTWKKKICDLTSVPTNSISIQYITFEDKWAEMDRKAKLIEKMEKLNSELTESTAKMNDLINELENKKSKW